LAVALHYALILRAIAWSGTWDIRPTRTKFLPAVGTNCRLSSNTAASAAFFVANESEYDAFGAGHASTSLSAALEWRSPRDRKGEDHHVVALIGDASLAGGMAMEAVNQAGHLKTRLIVVLNDNEMSIAPAVGALTGYLNRIREAHGYHRFKDEVEEKLLAIPSVGSRLHHAAKTMKDAIAAAVLPGALVNELGFKYIDMLTATTCAPWSPP